MSTLKKIVLASLLSSAIISAHFVLDAHAIVCTNTFPASYNNYVTGNCIPSAWGNTLEQVLGLWNATSSSDNAFNELRGIATSSIRSNSSTISNLTINATNSILWSSSSGLVSAAIIGTNLTLSSGTLSANSGGVTTSSALVGGQWIIAAGVGSIYSTSSQPLITLTTNTSTITVLGPSSTGTAILGFSNPGYITTSSVTINASGSNITVSNGGGSSTVGFVMNPTFFNLTLQSPTNSILWNTSSGLISAATIGSGLTLSSGTLTAAPSTTIPTNDTQILNGAGYVAAASSVTWTAPQVVSSTFTFPSSTNGSLVLSSATGTASAYGGSTYNPSPNCVTSITASAAGALSGTSAACSGGGGGSASTTIYLPFELGDAALPNSNFPAFNKASGTSWVSNVLDFNSTTTNYAYWNKTIDGGNLTSIGSSTLLVSWYSPATTGTTVWALDYRCATSSATVDALTLPASVHSTSTAVSSTIANAFFQSQIVLTSSTFVASPSLPLACQFKLTEDTTTSSIRQDINVISILLELIK